VFAAATNDYPGNNKKVALDKFDFIGVRTDISCLDCDKYLVVDDDSAGYLMIIGLMALLV